MNKFLSICVVSSGLLLFGAPQASAVENGDRPFYGFFLSNLDYTNAESGAYGFARQTFNYPEINELIYEMTGNIGVYAATAIDGIYYAAPYMFESSMSMPVPRPMFSYNIYTGMVTDIGNWSDQTTDLKPSDMTYDRKNDRILAMCYGSVEGAGIYEVNRETGAMTLIRKVNAGGVIAADAFGRVFSINHEGQLLQIDMTKDNTSRVLYQLPFSYLATNQSLEFDITSNKLYWASNTLNNPKNDNGKMTWMVEITLPAIAPGADYTSDLQGYSYSYVGEIGVNSRFLGMYIPYATGGFDAPGFVTEPKAVSSPDGTYCTLTFKTPTTTFGGKALESLDGYDIYRDGVRIHTEKGNCGLGEAKTFEDRDIPVSGHEYRYDIVCFSSLTGDGPKTPVFAYVGLDAPKGVTEADVKVSDDFRKVTLSWTAPVEGLHGGTFDPSKTTFDIKRLPDNVVVAENLKECTVTDNLNRLLRYYYQITAKNEYGSSVVYTEDFVAGKPVDEFPVEENFESPDAFKLKWNSIDNNHDGMTWLYGTTLGHSVFGDYETTAEYIISPTSIDEYTLDADDWIISPPIQFESDKTYYAHFDIRSLTPETLEVYCGSKNVVDGMTKFGSFTTKSPQYSESDIMQFQTYSFELPKEVAGNIRCVGIRLTTPLKDPFTSYLQISKINIDAATDGVESISDDNDAIAFRVNNKTLTINGNFANAAIYGITGMKLMDIKSQTTDLSGLNGIVILRINGCAYKIML